MKKKLSILMIITVFIIGIGISVNASEIKGCSLEDLYYYRENPLYENEDITYNNNLQVNKKATKKSATPNMVSIQDYKSNDAISADIRDYMVKRTTSFNVHGKLILSEEINNDNFKVYINNIIQKAMSEELANSSSAGDYLKWSWGNYGASVSSIRYQVVENNYIYYLDLVFNFNYYTKYDQEEKLNNDIKIYINSNIDKSNDSNYQKISIVYDFIASNVRYDYTNLNDSSYMLKYTAYAALENKTAVCQGYAALIYKMLKESGVNDVRIITSSTHAWNIVKLNNKYYNIDSTWDEGNTKYYYFLKGSNNFTENDHIRSSEYCTSEFITQYPTSDTDFNEDKNYISMSKCTVSASIENYTYTGKVITPTISNVKYGNVLLRENTDYIVKYINNINAGTATIKVIGNLNYVGQITKTFKINPININSYTVNFSQPSYVFDGKYKEPAISVNGLTLNKDYYVKYSNNYYSGIATAMVIGQRNYIGSISKTFKINPAKTTGFKVSKNYTDKIKLKWSKQLGVTGYKLYKYNSKIKKYEYIKTLNANTTSYNVKKLSAGNSYKFKIRAYKDTSNGRLYGEYSNIINTATLPNKVAISSVKSGSKKITVKWKKVSACTGYEIQYSTSSKFTSSKTKKITINGRKSVNKVIKGLKKRQKYYVRVRAYATVNGKKYYGSYSKVKIINVR